MAQVQSGGQCAGEVVLGPPDAFLLTLAAEVFGTAILGGLSAYPVAIFLMGKEAGSVAFYAYIVPFLISTAAGSILSGSLVFSLQKAKALKPMQETLA